MRVFREMARGLETSSELVRLVERHLVGLEDGAEQEVLQKAESACAKLSTLVGKLRSGERSQVGVKVTGRGQAMGSLVGSGRGQTDDVYS